MPNIRPRRLLRNSRACDFCHKRRIKCQSTGITGRCQNCADFDVQCTYSRPSRRGTNSAHGVAYLPSFRPQQQQQAIPTAPTPPSNHAPGSTSSAIPLERETSHGRVNQGEDISSCAAESWTEPLSPAWQGFARTALPTIRSLLAVYHETVYPIFPFFDPNRLERRLETLELGRNRGFFCSVMAACALASARIRDGALASSSHEQGRETSAAVVPPEMFFAAAEEALPKHILACRDFDHLRGYALLALASLQGAKIRAMHMYIGHYFTVLAINQWHDERNWPEDIGALEREEWRRLYWSMYTLDVYASIVWDGCIHYQESHAKVEYPSGENNSETAHRNQNGEPTHWITGWNFTTDLYRILEHNLTRLRSRSSKFNLLGGSTNASPHQISQHRVTELYSALPPIFKQLQPATGDPARDIYGFQAANIQATMALLRMVYLSLENSDGVDLETKCSVVSDVLETFHQVPKPYLRAISTPLIYHIGGIGIILGSVMEGPLSESSCRRVRELLLSMAELLESLEAFLYRSAGAGQRLRDLVVRLEEYMQTREEDPRVFDQGQVQDAGVEVDVRHEEAFQDVTAPGNAWGGEPTISDLSPQFQLPDELLLRDWTWPFAMSNTYLSF